MHGRRLAEDARRQPLQHISHQPCCLRQFLSQGQGGVILNMASVLAFAPSPRYFDARAYTAAKGGVIALSQLAAARYACDGIRVNVLLGLTDTPPMSKRAIDDPDSSFLKPSNHCLRDQGNLKTVLRHRVPVQ